MASLYQQQDVRAQAADAKQLQERQKLFVLRQKL
jgi:hypothetical protein